MKELGFGIIGAGAVAPNHIDAIEKADGARFVAVADTVEERARRVGEENGVAWYTDYRHMLENPDIDVVCVCVPCGIRGQIIMDAAAFGKHVVAEKPLEITLEKTDAAIEACDRAGVKLAVMFQNRCLDDIQELKRSIDDGRLGRLVLGDAYVKWYRPQSYYDVAKWRGFDGGGALINHAIHYVDLLQWIMGPVEMVSGFTGTLVRKIEVEDTAVACLRFKNGALGVIEACTSPYPGLPAKLEIQGEKGTIITENGNIMYVSIEGEDEYHAQCSDGGMGGASSPAVSPVGHARQIADMVASINEDRPPMVDGHEGRKAVEIVLAIYESSRTGKTINLPL